MKYDPIMCMMVDDSVKTEDAKSYGKYKLPNGEIVEVIDRKNVHGADTIVYKNSRGVHFATADWFMSNAKKVRDSVKTEDAMFVQLKFGSGRTEGAKLEENEYREYAEALLKKYGEKRVTLSKQGKVIVTYTNPNDSKTIDHAIRSCDISMYERIYQEAKDAVGGKYGIISNLSDLETAINDANRRGEKEDAKKLKAIYKKYN